MNPNVLLHSGSRDGDNVLRAEPELTGHADGTMGGKTSPEFPSGLWNITFNSMFVVKGRGHRLAKSRGLIQNLESFHSICRGTE